MVNRNRIPDPLGNRQHFPLLVAALGLVLAAVPVVADPAAAPGPRPSTAPQARATEPPPANAWADGIAAYGRGDFPAYERAFEALAKVAPEHPMVLARLASAYALNGRTTEAIGVLSHLADLGVWTDLAPAGDFATLVTAPAAAGLRLRLQSLRSAKTSSSELAFRIPDSKLVPEGVAYDARTGGVLVSSQYERKIVRRSSNGAITDLVGPAQDGIWMVFGLAADAPRRLLWAASTAEETMQRAGASDTGRTGLFAFDLDSGKLRAKLLPPAGSDATFDDVTVAPDGTAYVSDSANGTISAALPGAAALTMILPPGQLGSPQGMALSADGKLLYVSDYGRGIFALELKAGIVLRLRVPAAAVLLGFDGLQRSGNCLIAIQNGVEPHRVLSLRLASDGLGIERVQVLEANTPLLDEPTLGAVTPDGFLYVANSQGGKFRNAHGDFSKYAAAEPVLLRIPTASLCPP